MDFLHVEKLVCASTESSTPIATWFALGISLFALLVTAIQAYLAHKANQDAENRERENKKKSVDDHFWLREIIIPKCIDPAIELTESLQQKYGTYDSFPEFFRRDILDSLNNLMDQFQLANSLETNLGTKLTLIVEDLEEKFTILMDENDNSIEDSPENFNGLLINFVTEIISTLKKEQLS